MIVVARQHAEFTTPTRYDRKLHQAALAALSASKYSAVRHLNCSVVDGVVEISGTVPSFYLKQLAQSAVMQLGDVSGVRNFVQVSGESPILVDGH